MSWCCASAATSPIRAWPFWRSILRAQRTGGALLGDRIRMNAINSDRIYMRSLATRESQTELSAAIRDAIDVVRAAGFDLVLVETSGIGQGNAEWWACATFRCT